MTRRGSWQMSGETYLDLSAHYVVRNWTSDLQEQLPAVHPEENPPEDQHD